MKIKVGKGESNILLYSNDCDPTINEMKYLKTVVPNNLKVRIYTEVKLIMKFIIQCLKTETL